MNTSAKSDKIKNNSNNENVHQNDDTTTSSNTHKYLALLLGIGLMTPWNAFITTSPYFASRLCSVESYGIHSNFEAYFALLFNISNVAALVTLLGVQRYYHNHCNVTSRSSKEYYDDMDEDDVCSTGSSSTIDSYEMSWRYSYTMLWGRVKGLFLKTKKSEHGAEPIIDPSYFLEDVTSTTPTSTLEEPLLSYNNAPGPEKAAASSYISLSNNKNLPLSSSPQLLGDSHYTTTTTTTTTAEQQQESSSLIQQNDLLTKLTAPSLGAYTAAFALAALMVFNVSLNGIHFFSLTVVLVMICGVTCSIASAGLFHTTNLFTTTTSSSSEGDGNKQDSSMNTIFLAGQSVSGLFISIINFISVASNPPLLDDDDGCLASSSSDTTTDDTDTSNITRYNNAIYYEEEEDEECSGYDSINWSAFLTYSVTCITLLACIAAYCKLNALPITLYHRLKQQQQEQSDDSCCDANTVLTSLTSSSRGDDSQHTTKEDMETLLLEHAMHDDDVTLNFQPITSKSTTNDDDVSSMDIYTMICVLWRPILTVFVTFFVTLAIFPVWITKLDSVDQCVRSSHRIYSDLFQPMMFIVYNGADVLGKFCAGRLFHHKFSNINVLVYASLARFLLIPALLLCHTSSDDDDSDVMTLFRHSDVWPVLFVMMLGFSNGSVSAMGMMQGPAVLMTSSSSSTKAAAADQEMCSTVMVLVTSLGLMCGSIASFAVLRIGTGSW